MSTAAAGPDPPLEQLLAGQLSAPGPQAAPGAGKRTDIATSTDPSTGSYTITGGQQGKQRLDLLAEIMRPTTLQLLAEAGLRGGDRCLDLGCGGGNVTLDMARIVGPDGLVAGVDFDPQIVELARQDAADAGAGNVEYHAADARTFDGGPFDLTYARFLCPTCPGPELSWAGCGSLPGPAGGS